MVKNVLSEAILVDTSAVIALHDPNDQYHAEANNFFSITPSVVRVALNATIHEAYTRGRYDFGFYKAIQMYDFLTGDLLYNITFQPEDENPKQYVC
jgi:predicted nucleic acid-binding protein